MNIGILQADSVRAEFRQEFGDYPDMFKSLLLQVTDKPLRFTTYVAEALEFPGQPDECDGYLITGSRHSVYDEMPWIDALNKCVRSIVTAKQRLVGICFGHQLIAHLFGGKTGLAQQGWGVGVQESQVTIADAQFDSFAIISSHKDQVLELPEGAELVASNVFCPIAGFKMGNEVLTFQGHPEFSKGYARSLMDMRRELLGDAVHSAGIASLQSNTDEQLVAKWIIDFFEHD